DEARSVVAIRSAVRYRRGRPDAALREGMTRERRGLPPPAAILVFPGGCPMTWIYMLFAVVLVFAAAPAFADDKADLKALAGTWKVEKAEIEGKDQSATFNSMTLVIDDGKYSVDFGGPK